MTLSAVNSERGHSFRFSSGMKLQDIGKATCTFRTPNLQIGGGAKVTYDFLLYRSFRALKPPEETDQPRPEK